MILTLTLNPGLDRTYFIDEFRWNKTLRSTRTAVGMGGKAIDASWILSELGYANTALGFAAGSVGRQMEEMLRGHGAKTDFVWVQGETRTNLVLVSRAGAGQTTVTGGGLEIKPEQVRELVEKYRRSVKGSGCVILGGSVPPGVHPARYAELVRIARTAGVPVVFDASGSGLAAGLSSGPTVVKPNKDELEQLSGKKIAGLRSAYLAARGLQEKYGATFIVTLGRQGALAVLPERAYRIPPLMLDVVSAAGAGDAVLAGLAAALSQRKPLEDGLRLGFAAAAAVCLTPATADCRRADVEAFLPRIRLLPYP